MLYYSCCLKAAFLYGREEKSAIIIVQYIVYTNFSLTSFYCCIDVISCDVQVIVVQQVIFIADIMTVLKRERERKKAQ